MVYTPHLPNYSKCSSAVIAPVLSEILNTSIRLGNYPSKLKIAKITPVFKSDDDTDANNNRLISVISKAFDTVDHDILLDKLNHHGFRGLINNWFFSYLKNHRTQTTQVGHHISDRAVVGYGVPQGPIIRPLLFCYM